MIKVGNSLWLEYLRPPQYGIKLRLYISHICIHRFQTMIDIDWVPFGIYVLIIKYGISKKVNYYSI